MKIRNIFSKGFTLIEILIAVAIIGMLATIVISNLSKAREKTVIAANIKEARQLATLFELEYSDSGSYSNLIHNAWIPDSRSCDTISVSGNYEEKYREICNSIMGRLGSVSADHNWLVGDGSGGSGQRFSIMVKVSPSASTSGQWFCIGSSGRTYNGTYTAYGLGCYYNP